MVLPSDSSLEYFPNNTSSRFTVRLPKYIHLQENDWDAALVHISYPRGWFNWTTQQSLEYPLFADFTMKSGKETFPIHLPPFNYKTLREVWEAIAMSIFKKRSELLLEPQNVETVYNKNHFVHIKTLDKNKEYDFDTLELWTPADHYLYLPVHLSNLLGLTKPKAADANDFETLGRNMILLQATEQSEVYEPVKIQYSRDMIYLGIGSPQECKMWVGFNLSKQLFPRQLNRVMVYSNIVESQLVGNKTIDLLREVVVDHGQGDPVRYEPTHPQFIPVRKRNFDSITIEMYSTSGKLIEFDHGNTLVTMLFSRRSHRV